MATKNVKETSSTTEKAADTKGTKTVASAPKKAGAQKAQARKPEAEEKTVKKAAAKKPATRKSAAKKDIKVKAVVEYYGKQVEEQDMIADVKRAWTKSGKKVGDIKTMELYIKPEEAAIYYVINGTETGAVAF